MLSKVLSYIKHCSWIDRIGRIETVLYSLVEQQRAAAGTAGAAPSAAVLNELAQGVKQIQALASGSEMEDSPENVPDFGSSGAFQYPNVAGGSSSRPQQTDESRPANPRRYPGPSVPPHPSDKGALPREAQRRRIHPPTQSYSPSHMEAEEEAAGGEDSEMVQMTGQLSLDENKTVRYHGSSSGLDLLTRSKRFDGTFWNLPNPGFWPMSDRRTVKTEVEIDSKTKLPPIHVQDRLLE
jgi:hypothetical protein